MICNNNYLADILGVCEIKDLIWVMRFQSPLVYVYLLSTFSDSCLLFACCFFFHAVYCRLLVFFKIEFFSKSIYQEHY